MYKCNVCGDATRPGTHICVDCYYNEYMPRAVQFLGDACGVEELKFRHPESHEVKRLEEIELRKLS
jgi:hypothetical protein